MGFLREPMPGRLIFYKVAMEKFWYSPMIEVPIH